MTLREVTGVWRKLVNDLARACEARARSTTVRVKRVLVQLLCISCILPQVTELGGCLPIRSCAVVRQTSSATVRYPVATTMGVPLC